MSTSLLSELVADGAFRCPSCGATAFVEVTDALHCSACGHTVPIHNGVPDFFDAYLDGALGREGAELRRFATQLREALGLPDDPETLAAVVDVLRRATRPTADRALTAEIRDLSDRFGLTAPGALVEPRVARGANRRARIAYERHYFPPALPAATSLTRNVRVRNDGRRAWSSRTRRPMCLSYHWLAADGAVVVHDGPRSRFPVDVEPGRAISIPLRVETPANPGSYVLRVVPVVEDLRWVEECALDIPISVAHPITDTVDPFAGLERHDEEIPYAEDHVVGYELLLDHVRGCGLTAPLLLEIGGGTHPQAQPIPGSRVVTLDISAPLLELGVLYFGPDAAHRLCFVCGNALEPPLAPGRFDGVVMFATLHHFAQPEALLARARELTRADGFVAVMCEPLGASLEGGETRRDLLKGINEQVFTGEEYRWMFDAAGLRVERGRVDGDSLKVILRPVPTASE